MIQDWTKDDKQTELFRQRSEAAGLNRRAFMKIMAGASASLALAACAPSGAPADGGAAAPEAAAAVEVAAGAMLPDEQQILRQPWSNGEPSSQDFNRYLYCGGETELWAGLTRFDTDYKPVAYAAESWTISDDGTVYTFKLKPGQKWTNGDAVTAADFEWSFKRQLDPATQAEYAGFLFDVKNGEKVNTGAEGVTVDDIGVKVIDDLTLEITLEGPRGYFITVLAYSAALPAHRASVEKHGEKWTEAENIVTNGPWKLTKWDHEVQMIFERNDDFILEPKPKLRKRICQIIDTEAQLSAYEANEIDRALAPLAEIKRLKDDPVLSQEINQFSLTGTFYLTPSYATPPFDLKEVRRAVSHAIDRDAIVATVLQGIGQPAYTFVAPDSPGFVDPAKYDWVKELTEFNPQKAMDMLKGTPYEGGQNWPAVTLTYRADELAGIPALATQAIQAMLKDNLNMDVQLEGLEGKAFRDKMWAHDIQLNYVRWYMDYPDPNNNLKQVWYSNVASGHRHEFANEEYDTLVNQAAEITDFDKRMEVYTEAEKLMLEDGAAVYVYYPFGVRMYKPWVQGLPKSTSGLGVQDWNIYFALPQEVYIVAHPDRPEVS